MVNKQETWPFFENKNYKIKVKLILFKISRLILKLNEVFTRQSSSYNSMWVCIKKK